MLRCPIHAVATVAHVHEAGRAGEDLFLAATLRSKSRRHLLFEPEREPDFFALAQQHVDVARAGDPRQQPRDAPLAAKLIAVFAGSLLLQKHAAHELLRDRRSPLREDRASGGIVAPRSRREPAHPGAEPHLEHDARQAVDVDAGVSEEPLVFRSDDGVTSRSISTGKTEATTNTQAPSRTPPASPAAHTHARTPRVHRSGRDDVGVNTGKIEAGDYKLR